MREADEEAIGRLVKRRYREIASPWFMGGCRYPAWRGTQRRRAWCPRQAPGPARGRTVRPPQSGVGAQAIGQGDVGRRCQVWRGRDARRQLLRRKVIGDGVASRVLRRVEPGGAVAAHLLRRGAGAGGGDHQREVPASLVNAGHPEAEKRGGAAHCSGQGKRQTGACSQTSDQRSPRAVLTAAREVEMDWSQLLTVGFARPAATKSPRAGILPKKPVRGPVKVGV